VVNVLLIDARDINNLPETENLGLSSIASYLRKNSVKVTTVTTNSVNVPEDEIYSIGSNYDIFGIALFHNNTDFVYSLAKEIKKLKKNSLIVGGSRFATETADRILNDCADIDCIVLGDGEVPMLSIAEYFPDKTIIDTLPNVYTRSSKIDKYPAKYSFSVEESIDHDYSINTQGRPSAVARIYSKRGCACNCNFCLLAAQSQKSLKKYRSRPVEDIFKEIKYLNTNHGFRSFMIHDCPFDDAGKAGIQKIQNFCDLFANYHMQLSFQCMINGKFFDDKSLPLIKKMRKTGFTHVMFLLGAGNLDDEQIIKNQSNIQQKKRAIDLFKQNDIDIMLEFFCFNPFSTVKSWQENIEFLNREKCYQLSYYINKVPIYSGTSLHLRCLEEDLLSGDYSYKNVFSYNFKEPCIQVINAQVMDELRRSQLIADDRAFQNVIYLFNWLRGIFPESTSSIADEISLIKNELFSTIASYFEELIETLFKGVDKERLNNFINQMAAIYVKTRSLPTKLLRKNDIRTYLLRK
jgi:hypothetical protein